MLRFLTLLHFSMEDTTCQDLRSSCEYLERLTQARSASMDLELNMGCWLGNTLFFSVKHKTAPFRYQSRFICDTRGAGAGQLTVRIRGPKGAFRVEMQRESQKDRTILCKYEPTEPGDYRIEVRLKPA